MLGYGERDRLFNLFKPTGNRFSNLEKIPDKKIGRLFMLLLRLLVTSIIVLIGTTYLKTVEPMYANMVICFMLGFFASFLVPKRIYHVCMRFISEQWAKLRMH